MDSSDGLEVSQALWTAAERDHPQRLGEEVEPGLDGRNRHGWGPQISERHAIQQMGRPQRRGVEQHIRGADPREPSRAVFRRSVASLTPADVGLCAGIRSRSPCWDWYV